MCVIAVKYFKNIGWVGAKNRDRNYQPKINIIQSNRMGVQRLYIDDELTRYTEGLNEFGVCILSAALSVKDDEKESEKIEPGQRKNGYMSPDGKTIRDALLLKSPSDAVKKIIEKELSGSTFVFNDKECYIIEGGFTVKKADASKNRPRKYIYTVKQLDAVDGNFAVRTNHGIQLPQLGYQPNSDDKEKALSRKSSEIRRKYAHSNVAKCSDPTEMMNALAVFPNKNKFMNPIRLGDVSKGEMVTTGQLQLVPFEKTMHYRPLYSHIEVKYNKINNPKSKTFFEIISSRKLLGFKDYIKSRAQ